MCSEYLVNSPFSFVSEGDTGQDDITESNLTLILKKLTTKKLVSIGRSEGIVENM
jgi:hypothetical protein